MHLLYLDGSGSVRNPEETYFILAGISIYEGQIFHLIKDTEDFVERLDVGPPEEVELHASVIARGKRAPWKGMPRQKRLEVIDSALDVFCKSHNMNTLFAVAVHKQHRSPNDPVEYAFEETCNRFNLRLRRLGIRDTRRALPNKGLVVMDNSHYEGALQSLARTFRIYGTRWGHLRQMAEVPFFVDSRASRIIQLADLVAWSVWRRYEYGDTRFFDKIVSRFDYEGGVIHGLVHYRPTTEACHCPGCLSRASRDQTR